MANSVDAPNLLAMDLHTDEDIGDEQVEMPRAAPLRKTRGKKATQLKDMGKKDANELMFEYIVTAIERAAVRVGNAELFNDTPFAAEGRLTHLRQQFEKLQCIHSVLLEKLSIERCIDLKDKLAEIEEKYLFTIGKLAERAQQKEGASSQPQPVLQMNIPFRESEVRNTWGEFDGAIKKWPGFRDRFLAAVHQNDNISPAYKFQHLSQSLSGKAARTLGEWQLTADNYQLAWERLIELYDNKNAINRELLRSLVKLPVLTGPPRAAELQRMSNVTHESLRQLKAQGVPVDYWDVMIIFMLQERLDAETAKQWELQHPNDSPTVKDMLQFLDHQASALATAEMAGRERQERVRSVVVRPILRTGERAEVKKMPCAFCGSIHHPVWECANFHSLSLLARNNFVRERVLCPNCLKSGHDAKNCYQKGCPSCRGVRHNSWLCPAHEKDQQARGKRKHQVKERSD